MRISDWSSDVCSSDLFRRRPLPRRRTALHQQPSPLFRHALWGGPRPALLFQLRADPRRCRHSAQPRSRRRPYRALRVAGAGVLMEDRAPPPAPEDEDEGRSVLARLLLWFGFGLAALALFAAAPVAIGRACLRERVWQH